MNLIRYWAPSLLIAAAIFGLSSRPGNDLPEVFWLFRWLPPCLADHSDKLIHGAIYAALSASLLRALVFGPSPRRLAAATERFGAVGSGYGHAGGNGLRLLQACGVALLVCAAYGASDEWHQSLVPGRSCDFFDWLADGVGSLAAIVVLYGPFSKRIETRSTAQGA